ncbi:PrgI family protein [Zongyangia sp. HA2173]|mgnify:FL=1|uniref:PrgI family mobile element protein n=1 Tax=Zongyangia sp. HA2173 TaxID=3133035 RepID=UPI00174A7CAE
MEVKVPKEIRDYQESIFFGLSTRQFICSLLAVGVAVGLYFGLRPLVGNEEVGWMCILGAVPFAACGFFKYHGMTAEQVAWAWFKSEFLYPKKLVFKSDSLYYEAIQDAIAEGEKPPRKRKKRKPQPPAGKEQGE